MAESQRSDDRSQARSEAAALLGVDIDHLSPADSLRVDMISSLRLVIDSEQASVLSGGAADLGKLNVAVQSLIALLPGRELPAPAEQHGDPRVEMLRIYMQMRERGEIGLTADRVAELEAESERLRGQLVAGGLIPALPDVPTAITPPTCDIVPPSERAECDPGPSVGLDDPPKRAPVTIEASAPAKPPRPAWEDWLAAGGSVGGDRWSNRNIP
jgi:hypothetical protein